MLVTEFPEVRSFEAMARANSFVLEFLELVAKETKQMMSTHQLSLKKLLEASRISENAINTLLSREREQFTSLEFLVFLDSEIESQEENSPAQNLLVTIKLRVLDEVGKG